MIKKKLRVDKIGPLSSTFNSKSKSFSYVPEGKNQFNVLGSSFNYNDYPQLVFEGSIDPA
jgi:hypothetical protein